MSDVSVSSGPTAVAYFATNRGKALASTAGLSFLILLLLNTGTYQTGSFLWMHCIAFAYALNGLFLFMHGIMGDMELPRNYLVSYFGSGGAMLITCSFMAAPYTTHTSSTLLATIVIVLVLCLGSAMVLLAIFVKKL